MALRNAQGMLKDLIRKNEHIVEERAKLNKDFKGVEQQKDSMYRKFE